MISNTSTTPSLLVSPGQTPKPVENVHSFSWTVGFWYWSMTVALNRTEISVKLLKASSGRYRMVGPTVPKLPL